MLIIVENLQKLYFKKAKLVKNIKKCWKMSKNVEMLKNVDTKIKIFLTQIIFFFDKKF